MRARTSCSFRSNGSISCRVHRRGAPSARQARWHDLGKGQDSRQEGDARHGRGAAQALRRPKSRSWPRLQPDTHWQQEFEDAFEWELTPDQRTATADIKGDMESPSTMDRLLCGDVGYGKTEVAMRAAFKAAMDGKQVAILAPRPFSHSST